MNRELIAYVADALGMETGDHLDAGDLVDQIVEFLDMGTTEVLNMTGPLAAQEFLADLIVNVIEAASVFQVEPLRSALEDIVNASRDNGLPSMCNWMRGRAITALQDLDAGTSQRP